MKSVYTYETVRRMDFLTFMDLLLESEKQFAELRAQRTEYTNKQEQDA